jgi:hypothetical protein
MSSPKVDSAVPTVAVWLFSTFKLNLPKINPSKLATPPQIGINAAHKLINPSVAEACPYNFALCNSES